MENALMRLEDVQGYAEIMVKSGLFKDTRDVAQAAVKILAGQELGLSPIASMRGIDIVQGQTVIRAHTMAAMIKRSGRYNYKVLLTSAQSCKIEFFDNGESSGTVEFTVQDAKDAGLLNKDNWRKYTKQMLYNRAMSNGAKMYCSEIFLGAVYDEGEIEEPKRLEDKLAVPQKSECFGPTAKQIEQTVKQEMEAPFEDDDIPDPEVRIPGCSTGYSEESKERARALEQAKEVFNAEQEPDDVEWGQSDGSGDMTKPLPRIENPCSDKQLTFLCSLLAQMGVRSGDSHDLVAKVYECSHPTKTQASKDIEELKQAHESGEKIPVKYFNNYVSTLRDRFDVSQDVLIQQLDVAYGVQNPKELSHGQQLALIKWFHNPVAGKEEPGEREELPEPEAKYDASFIAGLNDEQMAWLTFLSDVANKSGLDDAVIEQWFKCEYPDVEGADEIDFGPKRLGRSQKLDALNTGGRILGQIEEGTFVPVDNS